jgi:hypothetical protein
MNRTVKIDDRTYTIAPLKFGQAREIFSQGKDAFEANCEMVAACLNNADVASPSAAAGYSPSAPQPAGGGAGATLCTGEKVKDLPYPDGQALMLACLEINGLKQVGES